MGLHKSLGWRAEHGDANAQLELGLMYLTGEGIANDLDLAAHWFKQAARAGSKSGQHYLNTMHRVGYGLPVDFNSTSHEVTETDWPWSLAEKCLSALHAESAQRLIPQALRQDEQGNPYDRVSFTVRRGNGTQTHRVGKWYRFAAELGNACGQYHYGAFYESAELYDFAYEWYSKAAIQGYADALFQLGRMYNRGTHVRCDMVLAHTYYNLAYLAGSLQGKHRRDGVILNRYQQDEAFRLARSWNIGDPLPESSETGMWKAGVQLEAQIRAMVLNHDRPDIEG